MLGVESLEGRTLLSHFYSGPTPIRPVQAPGGMFLLTMSGPGYEKVQHVGKGAVALTLFGTTQASTLNVALTRPRPHAASRPLEIASIRVVSGTIGGITANAVTLTGAITPLNGGVSTLQFAGLGPSAQIDVNGSLGSLAVGGGVALGPAGHVRIAGDLGQTLAVGGQLALDGGTIVVGHDLTGSLSVNSLQLTNNGSFLVGHDLTGGAAVNGNLSITTGGVLAVGHNLGGLSVAQQASIDSGGHIDVTNDLVGTLNVGEGLSLSGGARISVGRDVTTGSAGTGGIVVSGDLTLDNASIVVGRNLDVLNVPNPAANASASLSINGNLVVNAGGRIIVGGNLDGLGVHGVFQGNGTTTPDLIVGLDLDNLTVLGGIPNRGSIEQASVDVGKSIIGLTAAHGIFDSLITAGVAILNVTIGPDGNDAISNSDIRAGARIDRFVAAGNVRSTFATDPKSMGYPTRIIAGETRQGAFGPGGVIDRFQITGQLIDAVLAASVQPYGGDGSLPTVSYGQPYPAPAPGPGDLGNDTYDAPMGTTTISGTPARLFNNWTEINYKDGVAVSVAWDHTLDPTIDDFIFPGGSINPSYAQAGGLPSKPTVLGGVVSTKHGDEADFAGMLAADTSGVFVGGLPG